MRLFDAYIAVDWSSKNTPTPRKESRDAIWVGESFFDDEGCLHTVDAVYCRTRHTAQVHVRSRLQVHVDARRRVFLGFDFPYGYPAGFARALGLADERPPWRQVWDELTRLVEDNERNRNNRFLVADALNARCGVSPGPFWGHDGKDYPALLRTKSDYPYWVGPDLALKYFRIVENVARGSFSAWQLFGNGSVGGQCLVGIPVVHRLRYEPTFAPMSRVWPFETGFTAHPTPEQGPFVLHAEIWPGVPLFIPAKWCDDIRDREQVRTVVCQLAALDADGHLGALFDTPRQLSREAVRVCEREEGWILGSGFSKSADMT